MTALYISELRVAACPVCNGEGRLEIDQCETCRETGAAVLFYIRCDVCDGTGMVEDDEGMMDLEYRCGDGR